MQENRCTILRNLRPWSRLLSAVALVVFLSSEAGVAQAQWFDGSRSKNSAAVRKSFREIVADARRATVLILDGEQTVSLGTIVDSRGYILTKASVLPEAINCRLFDEREFAAELVSTDGETDLATIKIDATDLKAIRWQADSAPTVGQILATAGDSESPLAIGIVSVAPRTISAGRGFLGIAFAEGNRGPEITEVTSNSAAFRAGLKVGDIVTHIASRRVRSGGALRSQVGRRRPGEEVSVTVLRNSQTMELTAILDSPPGNLIGRAGLMNRLGGPISRRRTGFSSAIEHDTVLRPQDCGGPVVTLDGLAVGINIARAGRTSSYAIPASEIMPLIRKLPASDSNEE